MPKTEKPQKGGKRKSPPPPLRMQRLKQLVMENPGMADGKLMEMAGYSKGYAKNPKLLKQSLSWQQLIDRDLSEKTLTRKHKQLLNAEKMDHKVFPASMTDEEITKTVKKLKGAKLISITRGPQWARAYFSFPDNFVQRDAVDMGYKLRGVYKSDRNQEKANENLEKALERIDKLLPDAEI